MLANERRLRGTFTVLAAGILDRLSVLKLPKELDETVRQRRRAQSPH